jgi:thiol-disulfide isomerase/thioredoxin
MTTGAVKRLLVVAAAALVLAGCTSRDGIAGEDGGGYVSGDGTVLVVPAADRAEVPAWGGDTVDGASIDSADLDGVVVLNFWYAGCPPCRVEAPDLEEVFQQYGDRVTFLGVNVRDSAATASSFEREFGVTYDSILDVSTRDVLSAFAGQVPPSAVPTTLVLDAEGRVAARISGMLPSATTLGDLIDQVLGE